MDRLWLPTGHHYDLHIRHVRPTGSPVENSGGGPKIVWHTTEGRDFATMDRVLRGKRAEPHLLVGRAGTNLEHFSVIQYFPLDVGSRALMHPSGTPATNGANCIQIEVCEFAKDAHTWDADLIHALAQLTRLLEHRTDVPRKAPRPFKVPALRYSGAGFVKAKGHVGHGHVPNNDHWDPGRFPWSRIKARIEKLEA